MRSKFPLQSLLPVVGSGFGSAWLRMVVRLDSGFISFLNSGHKDSNRLDSRLRSVCSRPGSARGSAHRTSGLGTVCSRHGSARGTDQLETRISSRLCSSHLGFGSAHYSRFSLHRLVDLDRLGDRLEARRISSMLGSAELRARLGAQLKIGWGWGIVVQLGLAWLRAQFGSLSSAWCLGSARGSARTGSPAQLEVRAQGSALSLDRSPARLISARNFILGSLWFGSVLAWSSARAGLVKSVDLLTSYKSESTYPHGQSFWESKCCFWYV